MAFSKAHAYCATCTDKSKTSMLREQWNDVTALCDYSNCVNNPMPVHSESHCI